ncbi:hypothetical protein Z043_124784, partial [Scleropages formosus]
MVEMSNISYVLQLEGADLEPNLIYPVFFILLFTYLIIMVTNIGIMVLIAMEKSLQQPIVGITYFKIVTICFTKKRVSGVEAGAEGDQVKAKDVRLPGSPGKENASDMEAIVETGKAPAHHDPMRDKWLLTMDGLNVIGV